MRAAVRVLAVLSLVSAVASSAAAQSADAAAEREVRAVIAAYNADYARNDLDAYFRAFAADLTQWFPAGARRPAVVPRVVDQVHRRRQPARGGRGARPARAGGAVGRRAVATYVLRVTTRSAKGEVATEDNQETDVLFKRAGTWRIVHVNYAPARVQPGKPGQ